MPSATCRSCAPTTATATGSTRSSSTPRGTGCCGAPSSARSTACRGASPQPGAHVVRAALFTLWGNANDGVMCPVSMTYAAVPALRDGAPELAAEWEPRLTQPDYDHGALAGMAMTERQGGSDVRANITRAEPVGDGAVRDPRPQVVLLVSAVRRVPGAGPGARRACRASWSSAGRGWSSSGSRTSSARARCRPPRSSSAAITGRLIGEEGRGVPAIIRMVNHTRLDCLLGATTGLRRGHGRGDPPRPSPLRVRRAAGPTSRRCATCWPTWRSSPRRRPRRRCGSRAATTSDRAGLPALRHRGDEVLGVQARRRRTPPRRSSAWAATASSRTRGCRCCIATRR